MQQLQQSRSQRTFRTMERDQIHGRHLRVGLDGLADDSFRGRQFLQAWPDQLPADVEDFRRAGDQVRGRQVAVAVVGQGACDGDRTC
jgi:hypothetical protein